MKSIVITFLIAALVELSTQQTGCTSYYTVKSGDSCASIMFSYNINSNTFYANNPNINCNALTPGQTVCISSTTIATTTVAPAPTCQSYYIVKSGDTCASIMATYGQTTTAFYANNPTINCNNLVAGQTVCLNNIIMTTTTTPAPTCQSYYIVKSGDTCASIMATYGQTTTAFYANNPTINCNNLVAGQTVCLNNIIMTTTTTPAYIPVCHSYYTVKAGDSCASIINTYGQVSSTFYANNPTLNCNNLVPGQTVCLYNVVMTTTAYVPSCSQYYTVKAGDTCAGIISTYGQNPDTFYANNPTLNCNNLVAGQTVCLYNVITTTPAYKPVCDQYYTVKSGDTCASIINSYGQNTNTFYANNPTINCNYALTPGQIICLQNVIVTTTQAPFQPVCQSWYTVQAGDSCSYIINYYGQSSTQFTANNPSINCNNLQPGQSVCLGYPVQNSVYDQNCQSYYSVKYGDSCSSIQDYYNQDKNSWAVLNPTVDCNNLKVGQVICLGYPTNPEYDTQYCKDWHTIQAGETCSSMAANYGMTYNAFVTANPRLDCNNLNVGTTVCLGYNIASSSNTIDSCATTYTVQYGDSCTSIFGLYTQSWTTFREINPNLDCNNLRVGQVICLGAAQTETVYQQTCESYYTVQAYDTCASIIQNFGQIPNTFYASNPNINCNTLTPGQVVCIGFGTQKIVQEESCKQYYIVQVGDTCAGIINYFGEDPNTFTNANNHLDCNNLIPGERVCIGYQQTTTIYELNCESYYSVKSGDSCVSIISAYGQDANTFFSSNPSINCNNLHAGQVICLGYTAVDSVNLQTCQHYYTVQSGDSCATLINYYNQDQTTFFQDNPNVDCTNLYAGQIVCMSYDQDLTVYQKICTQNYIVKEGDTCASIILFYGQNENNFDASNPGIDCNNLQVGQVLCVSQSTITTNYQEQCGRYHVIDADDTCSGLITYYNQNSNLFYESNPNIDCNSLRVGQVVCLDYSTATTIDQQVCQSRYTIKSGDTCAGIIQLYGLDATRFYQANQNLDCNNLIAGQNICLDYYTDATTYQLNCEAYHTVQAGDTCSSIINYYNQDQNTFLTSNPSINCNNLYVGQRLCLGYSVDTTITRDTCQQYYTVQSGDTCSDIVQYYGQRGYNTDTFYAANPSLDCGTLRAGEIVCLGYQSVDTFYQQQCHSYYTVKSGDSCAGIISYFGQNANTFYAQNPSINCNNLQVGQVICLDTSMVDSNLQQTCSSYYTVKSGDSCSGIMTTYNQNYNVFYANNPSINCNNLQAGQVICLGTVSTITSYDQYCPRYYTVKPGDTCASIITYNNQNAATFYGSNPDLNCNNLQDGQIICLPTVV